MGMKEPKGVAKPIGGAITKPAVVSQYGVSMGGGSKASNIGVEQGIANTAVCKAVPQGKNSTAV